MMNKDNLELRMYGFIPYQLKGIQGGIQYGHAVVEYSRLVNNLPILEEQYNDWADNWKTFIIYNGGTTNDNKKHYGSMQTFRNQLKENNITFAEFREPDLGDLLTGVVYIADERCFNIDKYPDFKSIFFDEVYDIYDYDECIKTYDSYPNKETLNDYKNWVESIGGKKNLFLRKFNKQFKLAT